MNTIMQRPSLHAAAAKARPQCVRSARARTRRGHALRGLVPVALLLCTLAACRQQADGYLNFETIPRRAVAVSPDGKRLFVTNTPAATLHVFDIVGSRLIEREVVPVGLEPIAVAARTPNEVWVVNHLSDSVSVVELGDGPARVVNTLFVGDEPRDIVFAGPREPGTGAFSRAFITAARRGQNHVDDTFSEQRVPGVGRGDVWVFDASSESARLGGEPLAVVNYFADKQGPLAASPDGSRVYAATFTSGNDTSVIAEFVVCGSEEAPFDLSRQEDGPCGPFPGGNPGPNENQVDATPNPKNGVAVKLDRGSNRWLDILGRDWSAAVPFTLPDNDVFELDALSTPPSVVTKFSGVGTLNFGLAVHPSNGSVFVANTEAINMNRFLSFPLDGLVPNPGGEIETADPITGQTLNGHLYESRITILKDGQVTPRHLNKHIDYEVVPSPPGVKERSVSSPNDLVFSKDGQTIYVVALGSNKIVPFRTKELEADSFVPDASAHIELSGSGPASAALDPSGKRMFVYTRFDNAVAVVDLEKSREVSRRRLDSPEPRSVTEGRRFFYDSLLTSSNGEASCAVCHPSGDKDDLAWDLGTPFLGLAPNPNNFLSKAAGIPGNPHPSDEYNPLKGAMTVLTLRGIADSGPMLWRGDATNPIDFSDERANFATLNPLFPGLLGREAPLSGGELERLTSWALSIVPPPNPHRNLDNSLTPDQAKGKEIFTVPITDGLGATVGFPCSGCHLMDAAAGQFGTAGDITFDNESQNFKVTQLRTIYDKVGMFGATIGGPPVGDQVRAIGTSHNGSLAGPEAFTRIAPFDPLTEEEIDLMADFMLVFPSNLAPIVGQQVTLTSNGSADVRARIDLMLERATTPFTLPGGATATECELVVTGVIDDERAAFLLVDRNRFVDRFGRTVRPDVLLELARFPGQELTYTCWYPGGGARAAFNPTGTRRVGIGRRVLGKLLER